MRILQPSEVFEKARSHKYTSKKRSKSGKVRYIYAVPVKRSPKNEKPISFRSIIEGDDKLSERLYHAYDSTNGSDRAMQETEDRLLEKFRKEGHNIKDDRATKKGKQDLADLSSYKTAEQYMKANGIKLGKEELMSRITDAFMNDSDFFDNKMSGDTEATIGFIEDSSWKEIADAADEFSIDLAPYIRGKLQGKSEDDTDDVPLEMED